MKFNTKCSEVVLLFISFSCHAYVLHCFPSQKRDFSEEGASVLSAVSDLFDERVQPQRKSHAGLQVSRIYMKGSFRSHTGIAWGGAQ